jgi:hypothetical protein
MTVLRGRVWDRRRGAPLEARVQVMASTGELCAPEGALHKVGSGEPFFYADAGGFEVEVPGGPTRLVVERGTEYTPLRLRLKFAVEQHSPSNDVLDVSSSASIPPPTGSPGRPASTS